MFGIKTLNLRILNRQNSIINYFYLLENKWSVKNILQTITLKMSVKNLHFIIHDGKSGNSQKWRKLQREKI